MEKYSHIVAVSALQEEDGRSIVGLPATVPEAKTNFSSISRNAEIFCVRSAITLLYASDQTEGRVTVSYTHLDVYKRQVQHVLKLFLQVKTILQLLSDHMNGKTVLKTEYGLTILKMR